MVVLAGASLDASDFDLPDDVLETAGGAGTNTITATSWAVLPTNPVTAEIVNPHAELAMVVDVYFSAWLKGGGSGSDVRVCPVFSGAVTLSAGVGAGGATGWGEVLSSSQTLSEQKQSMISVTVPVTDTALTVKLYAYNYAGSGQQVNYPTLRLVPRRFVEDVA